MKIFAKIVNDYKSLTISVTSSVLDVLLGSEYVSAINSTLESNFQILSRKFAYKNI